MVAWSNSGAHKQLPVGAEAGLCLKPAHPEAAHGTGMPSAGSTSLGHGTKPVAGPLRSLCIPPAQRTGSLPSLRQGPGSCGTPQVLCPEETSLPLVPPVMGTSPAWHPWASPGWWRSTSPGCPTGAEEDQAPAATGLSAKLRRSPAASAQAKQLLIKGREGDEGSRAATGCCCCCRKGTRASPDCPQHHCHHGDLPGTQGKS